MASTVYAIVRRNWKKTVFFNCLSYYLSHLAYTRYKNFWMMREYCHEAIAQGSKPLPSGAMNKHITLLLNPVASDRKSRNKYEKYVEPVLHCAGFLVNVVQTERISEARDLTELIEKTNIIAVAGGDGSLLETITGLLRRDDADEAARKYPIAVIPAGFENTFAHKLYGSNLDEFEFIAEAGMAVARHRIAPKHVIQCQTLRKIQPESEKSEEETKTEEITEPATPPKPVFGMNGMKIGWHREAEEMRKNLPKFLGKRLSTMISLLRTPKAMLKAEIMYTPACVGCKKCYKVQPQSQGSLWSRFYSVFRPPSVYAEAQSARDNPDCGTWNSMCVETDEFNVTAMADGYLRVDLGGKGDLTEFVSEGLYRLLGYENKYSKSFNCNEVVIKPVEGPECCSIDNEEFELHEISMKLLKDKVYFFTQ